MIWMKTPARAKMCFTFLSNQANPDLFHGSLVFILEYSQEIRLAAALSSGSPQSDWPKWNRRAVKRGTSNRAKRTNFLSGWVDWWPAVGWGRMPVVPDRVPSFLLGWIAGCHLGWDTAGDFDAGLMPPLPVSQVSSSWNVMLKRDLR